ncbi:hypothetical protein TRIUR3_14631 [Triticum urartu]|uniref:Uncharacterized protein n=1 Tax=Triticum urartu TaxID=4572 RepID=M7YQV1_TRIUA|nr:hypothetical protein TRIUR3_14631 [Triticum urartu]
MAAAEESKGEGTMAGAEERERSYPGPSDPFIEVKFGNDFVDIPSDADESPAWSLLVGVKSGALRVHRFRVARSGRISAGRECASRRPKFGNDFVDIPYYADESPAWLLLVGVISGALRFHRFRVARSGRISGQSEDRLEIFHDLMKPQGCSSSASAALVPDGRSLCLLQRVEKAQTDALQLQLPAEEEPPAEVALPPLDPSMRGRCMPISADGHIWAVSATYSSGTSFRLLVQRLVIEEEEGAASQRWEQVGPPFDQHCKFEPSLPTIWGLDFLQGYAVLPGHGRERGTLILLSLQNGLFFTFNCSSPDLGWTKVVQTSEDKDYVPILGRGLYVQETNAIYMLRKNVIYEYKLGYEERSLKIGTPMEIIFPCVARSRAHGFLTHLGSGVMCSVLMSTALPCWQDHLHAIITTFQLGPGPHIKVLHSTSRQLDVLPMEDINEFEFRFLQHHLPPLPPPPYVKPHMDNELLFIICQAGSQSFIYKTSLMDLNPDLSPRLGIATPLKPHYIVPGDDHGPRHFFVSGSELYAVSFLKDGMYVLNLDTRCQHLDPLARRPVSSVDPFIMAIQVGRATLALTETLQVYRKAHLVCPPRSISWVRCMTDHSQIPDRKVKLSGYVVVSDNSFIVCDTLTCSCLHFDLDANKWHVVMPWAPWGEYPPRDMSSYRFLNGRCVFVDGFIYTCSGKGLAAYELLYEDNCVYLDIPIYLPLSWESEMWRTERMCLDYAGKDVNSGAILFWVVQGLQMKYRDPQNKLWITAVKVEVEKTPRKSMTPVGIRHVVSATRLIDQQETMDQKEVISTRCCAVSF